MSYREDHLLKKDEIESPLIRPLEGAATVARYLNVVARDRQPRPNIAATCGSSSTSRIEVRFLIIQAIQPFRLFARSTRYVTRARYSSDSAEARQRICSAVRPNNAKNSLTLSFSDMQPGN